MAEVIDLTREAIVIDEDCDDELIILEENEPVAPVAPVAAPVRLARLNSPYSVSPPVRSPAGASSRSPAASLKRFPVATAVRSANVAAAAAFSSLPSSSASEVSSKVPISSLPPLKAVPPVPRAFTSNTMPLTAPVLGKRKLSASFFAPARHNSKRPTTPSPSASASSPSAYVNFDFFPKDQALLQSKQAQLFAAARLRAQKKAVVQLPVWYTNAEAASTTDDDRRQACGWLAQHSDSAEKCLLVQPNCTQKIVQKHFRTLSVLVHPDKCKDKEAAVEAFKILNKNREVLLSRCRPGEM